MTQTMNPAVARVLIDISVKHDNQSESYALYLQRTVWRYGAWSREDRTRRQGSDCVQDDCCSGEKPTEVALEVGVARQTVYTWKALLDEGGIDALRSVPSRGRPARLDESQLEGLRRAILQKPTEHGFGTELWTLKRVGVVIERLYDVKFGQTQIWRILDALGFSVQKPEKRAIERDEDAVRSWKRSTWLALKKSPARRPTDRLCSVDADLKVTLISGVRKKTWTTWR
jgi:transposase